MKFDEELFKKIRNHRTGLDYSLLNFPINPTPEEVEELTIEYERKCGKVPLI